jgi:hypothetical protein
MKLVAASYLGGIYTSTNAGSTWTQGNAPNLYWRAVASSADGTKLVAVTYGGLNNDDRIGGIYTSTDSGMSWQKTAAPTLDPAIPNWDSVASSSDGTKLVAGCIADYPNIGFISVSKDAGTTWTTHEGVGQCYSLASSSDGTKLVAAAGGFGIYTSTDSGTNWTWTSAQMNFSWVSVASSSDGTKLAAVSLAGYGIYTSTNAGSTWIQSTNIIFGSVTSSADGAKLAAAVKNGGIYTAQIRICPALSLVQVLTNTLLTTVVIPCANNLMLGQNYQLQIANDLNNWTDFGSAFIATSTNWMPTNYWNVANTNQLFFRLKMF